MLTYRAATIGDVDQVFELMAGLYEHEHIVLDDRVKQAVRQLLKNSIHGKIMLIEHESHIAGYAAITSFYSLEFGGSCTLLDEFLILPEHRGKGFGREALKYLMESARQEGFAAVCLEVDRDNPKARKLYDSAGFKAANRDLMVAKI